MLTVYGIPNCDKCRAARRWFEASGAEFSFHDLRVDGLPGDLLQRWLDTVGSESLINKRSTTWRALPADQRDGLDATGIRQLLVEHPTLIRRPVVDDGMQLLVGYDESGWQSNFIKNK
jgi:arsenate reductase